MTPYTCFILSLLYDGDYVLKYALSLDANKLTGNASEYPMEPENRKQLRDMLPDHIRSIGPIVDVQPIDGAVFID